MPKMLNDVPLLQPADAEEGLMASETIFMVFEQRYEPILACLDAFSRQRSISLGYMLLFRALLLLITSSHVFRASACVSAAQRAHNGARKHQKSPPSKLYSLAPRNQTQERVTIFEDFVRDLVQEL
eukprot:3656932-Rhodomonas_salina.1